MNDEWWMMNDELQDTPQYFYWKHGVDVYDSSFIIYNSSL